MSKLQILMLEKQDILFNSESWVRFLHMTKKKKLYIINTVVEKYGNVHKY